jgi:hypothetical protein
MLLFISGWPACGETHYGEWLARRFDFQHLDLEVDPADASELHTQWAKLVPAKGPAFAARLQKKHPRWVLTGRAPTDNLPRLEALRAGGFSLWFLLARTESLSRQRWLLLEREKDPEVRPVGWEKQADAIRGSARALRPFFRDHCIETLNAGLELLDGDALAARLGVTAPVSS